MRFTVSPAFILGGVGLLIFGCALSPNTTAHNAGNANAAGRAQSEIASPSKTPQRGAHKRLTYPERKPQLGITTPMKGSPSNTTLNEARLVASSCEKATVDDADARVKAMRASVNESLKEWADAQPACWEEMREEYRMRKEEEREQRSTCVSFVPPK